MRDKKKDRAWRKARKLFLQGKKPIKKEPSKSKQSYLNDFDKKHR